MDEMDDPRLRPRLHPSELAALDACRGMGDNIGTVVVCAARAAVDQYRQRLVTDLRAAGLHHVAAAVLVGVPVDVLRQMVAEDLGARGKGGVQDG